MLFPDPLASFVKKVGPHEVEYEPPDLLHVHYEGDVELEHLKVFDAIVEAIASTSRAYVLRDARRGGTVRPETRAHIARSVDMTKIAGMVTYGSSFHARIVSTMLETAMRRLKDTNVEYVYFDSEMEARAWIVKHRQTCREQGITWKKT
ncbi:MAG TPA: hypothetical protein PKA58_14930 [Polyangium sp.]|jgi:hypothetical protein|nr:hypothetical protein [Polyangium sp.]